MQLNPLGPNQTEVTINGVTYFYSYKTLVAACVDGCYFKTNKKWSVTTSKHINRWIPSGVDVVAVSQDKLESMFV